MYYTFFLSLSVLNSRLTVWPKFPFHFSSLVESLVALLYLEAQKFQSKHDGLL
jgi:hypothetical protein